MDEAKQIAFPSLTVSDLSKFLGARPDQPSVSVRGFLHLPKKPASASPVVVISMGSTGLASGREALYAAAFTGAGIACLVVDSFASRGFAETVSDQGRLSQATSCADALSALEWLAQDERVDAGRAALMGYSRGGATVLMAADQRLQSAVLGHGLSYRSYIALYPSIWPRWESPQLPAAPLLMIAGSNDDLAPLARQRTYVDRLLASGGQVDLIVLPKAHHSFDANYPALYDPNNLNLCESDVGIDNGGRIYDRVTGARAADDWPAFVKGVVAIRGKRGATTGFGPAPADIAVEPILRFLKRTLVDR